METKSRYEIIAELEEKKAHLINALASIGLTEVHLKRDIELAKEAFDKFQEGKKINELNIKDQLASLEKSLERFNTQKK